MAARLLRLARAGPPTDAGPTDAELLARYADGRDEAAFAELVRRNGPAVLRACRSVLGRGPGADDAFQATFLLLARRAGGLTRPGSLAGWLHAAAVRVARTARRAEARRRRRERRAPPPEPADDRTWREVREVFEAELAALPERYRTPLVLCYLQGLTQAEAARRAGCPVGALRGRLERGKARLRERLVRHGLPVAVPALLLARPTPVPAALCETTLRVAQSWAAGGPVPESLGRLLAPAVRLKAALAAAAAAVVTLAGVGQVAADRPRAGRPEPAAVAAGPIRPPRTDPLGDPLPPGAVMRLGTRRFQVATWPVRPVPLPGGGHVLIYHSDPGRAVRPEFRWMDAASGVVTARWPVPDGHHAAGVSADGRWAVVARSKWFTTGARAKPDPKTAPIEFTLYDLTTRKPVREFACESEEPEGAMAQFHGAVVSADGEWVATVNSGDTETGRVRLWQVATGKVVWTSPFPDPNGPKYTPLGFTPGGGELVLRAAKDNHINVVDTAKRVVARSFPTTTEQIDGQALAPDGAAVVLGTHAPEARVWDVRTGRERAPLAGHNESARRFAFTPDGKTLVTGGNDDFLLVRDWPSGEVRRRIDLGRGAVQDLFVSGDGHSVDVRYWWENALARFDLATGKAAPRPDGTHRAAVVAVAATADGSVLSVGVDKVLRAWDPATGRQLRASPLDPGDGTRPRALSPDGTVSDPCAYSPDGRFRVEPGPDVGTISVHEVRGGKTAVKLPAKPAGWWTPTAVPAFSPDGRTLAAADGDAVRLWATDGWKPAGSIPAATSAVTFSPDGRSLATADLNDVTVWEVATRRPRAVVRAAAQWPVRPRFSPDGRFLAWLVRSESVEVWDVRRGRPAATLRGHDGGIRDFAFTAGGRSVVTASDDCTLLVWDVAGAADGLPAPAPPGDEALRAAFADLAAADPAKAWAAVRLLAAAPDRAVGLITGAVRPAAALDPAVVDKLLADLDSNAFAARERATAGLIAAGERAEGKVRAFLAASPSAEAARRAEDVLKAVTGPPATPDRLREVRAVEVLEWAGTPAAEDALRELARGAADAPLTRDAGAALGRVGPKH